MKITGQFRDLFDNLYSLEIDNPSISGETDIEITSSIADEQPYVDKMYFTDEPVELECDMDDMFTVIAMQSATINVLTKDFMGDKLFGNNARSITVKIEKNNDVIFDGYVEPGTFDQPFTAPYDEFAINCVDKLSTLEYYKYKDIKPDTLEETRKTLSTITFKEILDMCIGVIKGDGHIYYDMSKGVTSSRTNLIFNDLKISEQTFIGDDYDSVWTLKEVLEQMLQYLNLHIRQIGSDFYIFDWDTIKNHDTSWVNLDDNEYVTISSSIITLTKEMNAGEDTTISIDEVYNQIKVTDDLQAQDNVIESPLEAKNLSSPFMNKQLYCTEYFTEGEGNDAIQSFAYMVLGGNNGYDAAKKVDWYIQQLECKNWKFYDFFGEQRNQYEKDANGVYINQWKYCDRNYPMYGGASLLGIGSVESSGGQITDDAPQGYIKLSNYLVVSINGNESSSESTQYPSESWLQFRQPLAEFLGTQSGNVYSPTDDETTNYLVFSGKLILQPKQHYTAPYSICVDAAMGREIPPEWQGHYPFPLDPSIYQLWHRTVPSENNGDGRYYTRKFYKLTYPNDPASAATTSDYGMVMPYKDKANHKFHYQYSSPGNNNDTVSNLDILECELIIGNKRLVQWYDGDQCKVQWVRLGQEPQFTDPDDGTVKSVTTFQLGVNPKIDDYIIGQEYDIRSNVSWEMNLDATGFAIPIKKSDALSGQILFRITGLYNGTWRHVDTYTHGWWFWKRRHWDDENYPILAYCDALFIKEFKCKLMSNNAGYNADYVADDKDLVYLSNETDNYIEVKDDIDFKIITQLTTQEALQKGVKTDTNYNAVFKVSDGQQLQTIYNANTHETYKPEEHYVSQYYLQYYKPKVILDVDVWDDTNINYWNKFKYNALNRNFMVRSMNYTLHDNKKHLTLVETI